MRYRTTHKKVGEVGSRISGWSFCRYGSFKVTEEIVFERDLAVGLFIKVDCMRSAHARGGAVDLYNFSLKRKDGAVIWYADVEMTSYQKAVMSEEQRVVVMAAAHKVAKKGPGMGYLPARWSGAEAKILSSTEKPAPKSPAELELQRFLREQKRRDSRRGL